MHTNPKIDERWMPINGRTLHGEELEPFDGDRSLCQLNVFTGPNPIVGALSVNLDGTDRAGLLQNVAGQPVDPVSDGVVGDTKELFYPDRHGDFTLAVISCRLGTKSDGGGVDLVEPNDVGQEACARADAQHQQARRHGVKGASMPNFSRVQQSPGLCDDIVAGETVTLVDEQDAIGDHVMYQPKLCL